MLFELIDNTFQSPSSRRSFLRAESLLNGAGTKAFQSPSSRRSFLRAGTMIAHLLARVSIAFIAARSFLQQQRPHHRLTSSGFNRLHRGAFFSTTEANAIPAGADQNRFNRLHRGAFFSTRR